MPKHNYFSSDVIFNQAFEAIEADKGIIRGVKVCSEGEAKGHGIHLNKKFIREVTRFGKEHTPGIKARFGHPNMCSTSLGTYIGRYKNFRTQIEKFEDGTDRHHSVADLHLDETAKNLPKLGNAYEYILLLAQSSPDMFGNSIVFTPGESEIKEEEMEDGTKVKKAYATIEKLHATDLVDEPAATDGLFSRFDENDMAMQCTRFFDQYPEVYEMALNHPEIVEQFMGKYNQYKLKKEEMSEKSKEARSFFDKLKDAFTVAFKAEEGEQPIPAEVPESLNAMDEKLKALESEVENMTGEIAIAKNELAEKDEEIKSLNDQITELNKLSAKSTEIPGKEGSEGDEEKKLSAYEQGLVDDLKKLQGEMTTVRIDK
jgi:hypothetical protein